MTTITNTPGLYYLEENSKASKLINLELKLLIQKINNFIKNPDCPLCEDITKEISTLINKEITLYNNLETKLFIFFNYFLAFENNYCASYEKNRNIRLFHFFPNKIIDLCGNMVATLDALNIISTISNSTYWTEFFFYKCMRANLQLDYSSEEFCERNIHTLLYNFSDSQKRCVEGLSKMNLISQMQISTPKEKLQDDIDQLSFFYYLSLLIVKKIKLDEDIKKEISKLPPLQKKRIYDIAFEFSNYLLYEHTISKIAASAYSINLMWINKKKTKDNHLYILGKDGLPEEQLEDFQKRLVKPVHKWAYLNPNAEINIWFDSAMVTQKIIDLSITTLKKDIKQGENQIHFRDIRSLPDIKANPEVFSSATPVYFRVDLLKGIICDHMIEKQLCVFADLDVKPLSNSDLFDRKTMDFLNDFGFVMAKDTSYYENSFFIFDKNNKHINEAHKKVLIDQNIKFAKLHPDAINEEQVYKCYIAMLLYYFVLERRFGKPKNDLLYNPVNYRFDRFTPLSEQLEDVFKFEEKKMFFHELHHMIPSKPVKIPPSKFSFSSDKKQKSFSELINPMLTKIKQFMPF